MAWSQMASRPARPVRQHLAAFIAVGLCCWFAGVMPALAQDAAIYLLGIQQGSPLSSLAQNLGTGGYELSDREWVSLTKWYHTDFPELRVDVLTQLSDSFGIVVGLGTGERGEKYRLDPSLKLGIITQVKPRPNSALTLSINTNLFGHLTEFPCEADFGELEGVEPVNCRLAASEIPAAKTLDYLVNADPSRLQITLSYSATF